MTEKNTILAVDDVEFNLMIMKQMLSGIGGFDFIGAANGVEALDILEQNPAVDIVLLDLHMPVMDGFETLIRIKKSDQYSDIPVIVVTSDNAEVLKTLAMGANDFMAKPFNAEELKLRVRNHIRSKKLNDMARDMNKILEAEVARKTSELRDALEMSKLAEFEISLRLGRAAEFRDMETGMHIRRVSEMSWELARLAGLPERECEILRYASPLHDVGKIGIPDLILLKPGQLDPSESQVMRMHTVIGGGILSDAEKFPVLEAGRIIALEHHEKWDGSGYPRGLAGTDIHIYGRLVMLVDVFDALTSTRPYKKAYTTDKALEIIKADRGTFFDPALVDLFISNLDVFLEIKKKFLDNRNDELFCKEQATHPGPDRP